MTLYTPTPNNDFRTVSIINEKDGGGKALILEKVEGELRHKEPVLHGKMFYYKKDRELYEIDNGVVGGIGMFRRERESILLKFILFIEGETRKNAKKQRKLIIY